MVPKYDIVEFVEVQAPITQPVTKFGGQPVWMDRPTWPISRSTGGRMEFMGQIVVEPELFGVPPDTMAYLFMTGDDEAGFFTNTWDPEGGENAVIVQPRGVPGVQTVPEPTGPSVRKRVGNGLVPCEFAVRLERGEDPAFVGDDELWTNLDEVEREARHIALEGNKVGGTPGFIQGEQYPGDGSWGFLMQLDMMEVPFHVNFGDAGVGYAFLSEDGRTGKFLWQCY